MSWAIRFHPEIAADLDRIAMWIGDYAGPAAADRKLEEIERVILSLSDVPFRGIERDQIASGIRAIPAGRKGVVVFTIDEAAQEVLVLAVTYAGADWIALSTSRRRGKSVDT